jgi:hypothetical protein
MIFLATVFAAIVYWICVDTTKALVILGIFIVLITVTSLIHLRKISKLRISRCDTICDFRKSFNPREVDPWIIRATYEGFTHLIDPKIPHFPLRATDLIEKDLGVDPDDIYDLLSEVADRAGYDLSGGGFFSVKVLE